MVDRPEGPSLRFSFPGEAVQKRRGLLRGFGVLRKLRDLRNRPKAGGEGFRNWPKMKIKAKLNSLLVGGSQREGETLCRPQPLVLRRKRTEAYRRPEPIGTERGVTEVLDEYMALTVNGLCSSIATVVAKVTSGTKLGRGISVGAGLPGIPWLCRTHGQPLTRTTSPADVRTTNHEQCCKPMGHYLAVGYMAQFETDIMSMSAVIFPRSYIIAASAALVILLVSQIPAIRQIYRLSLPPATKDWSE